MRAANMQIVGDSKVVRNPKSGPPNAQMTQEGSNVAPRTESGRGRFAAAVATVSPRRTPIKRAVVVGITYRNLSLTPLLGCERDARLFREMLVSHFHFKPRDIVLMTEEAKESWLLPTRRCIISELEKLSRKTVAGDSLVFYFSGHGVQMKDENGDELDGFDECLVPLDYQKEGVIIDDDLNEILVKPLSQGVKLHCVIDACHSGTVLDLPFLYVGKGAWKCATQSACKEEAENKGAVTDPEVEKKKLREAFVTCISGCGDRQRSSEVMADGASNGAMTLNFLRAIQDNKDITYKRLLKMIKGGIRTAEVNTVIAHPLMILTGRSLSSQERSSSTFDTLEPSGHKEEVLCGDGTYHGGKGCCCNSCDSEEDSDEDGSNNEDNEDDEEYKFHEEYEDDCIEGEQMRDGEHDTINSRQASDSGLAATAIQTAGSELSSADVGGRRLESLEKERKQNDPLVTFLSSQLPQDDNCEKGIPQTEGGRGRLTRPASLGTAPTKSVAEEHAMESQSQLTNVASCDGDSSPPRQDILKQSKGLGLLIHGAQIPQLSSSRKFNIKSTIFKL